MGRPERNHLRLVASNGARASTPGSALDDAELLAATVNGDASAAAAIHDRLRPRVASTVRRLLGPTDPDFEDCVQIAFVEIVRSAHSYRGDCALEHWASRIAAHVVYKHIRRRRLERRVFEGVARESQYPDAKSPGRQIAARSLIARVRAKLATLDVDKTYAFLLHDVLGFDLKEVAQISGTSVAAAQKRLVRGRRDVHGELAADPELAAALADSLEEEP